MYDKLYEIWKRELENSELQKLPSAFHSKIVEYLKKVKEESRMLDKRTTKAILLKKEMKNVKRMIDDLIRARYQKLVRKVANGERIPSDVLTTEEEKIYSGILPFAEAYSKFTKEILDGRTPEMTIEQTRKRVVLRFLKVTPSIVGLDMKSYGPFSIDDVASLPNENAKIMIKQGLAEKIEVS